MLPALPALPVYWHPDIALHDLAAEHVAMDSRRLSHIAEGLLVQPWAHRVQSTEASWEDLLRAHDAGYLETLRRTQELAHGQMLSFDRETRLNRHTWRALSLSAGAMVGATRAALSGESRRSFCVNYAGHHARRAAAAGFCFVNAIAVAGHYALSQGCERVAVLDFDTHAGDGTVLSFLDEPRVLFGETYQPGFPGAFLQRQTRDGIVRHKATAAFKFREYLERIFDRVISFDPELVIVSAGFDAHEKDPLTQIGVKTSDYAALGSRLAALPCPVVCGLEGGYNLQSTLESAVEFCQALRAGRPV